MVYRGGYVQFMMDNNAWIVLILQLIVQILIKITALQGKEAVEP